MNTNTSNTLAPTPAGIEQERSRLSDTLGRALHALRSMPSGSDGLGGEPAEASDFLWDSLRDTRYAHEIAGLDGLLHVFQQDWVGIRAAAGSLPGRKLALKPEAVLARSRIRMLAREIEKAAPRRIVMQGMSGLMAQLVEELAQRGMHERVFVVLHGAPSQWFSESEARCAFKCLELARTGKIRRLHVMKAGFEFPEPRLYRPMLFNLAPRLQIGEAAFAARPPASSADRLDRGASVLIPGWSGWRKNIYTNALGAALSHRVDEILAFGSDLALPVPLNGKLKIVPFADREQTFALIEAASLVMNVSLVDCHPMIHLEAQALGKACLRGPLFLDALEDHPYVRLTEVLDVSSPAEIRKAVDRVLDVPCEERSALAHDYQMASHRIALQRHRAFLEL